MLGSLTRVLLSLTILASVTASGFRLSWATATPPTIPPNQSSPLTAPSNIQLTPLGRYQAAGAEISAYDPQTRRTFTVGADQLTILNVANPISPTLVMTKTLNATSVDIKNGIVAIAVPADPVQNPGSVMFMDTNGQTLNTVTVGALPDMLVFTSDGKKVLVANEGEPSGTNDPEGSVSIIDITNGVASATVQTAGFTAFNNQRDSLISRGVRIFPNAASVAQDLEPEYIAIDPGGATARVTLQEANAVAALDIASATITAILPLGLKEHLIPGAGLDASDRDGPSGGKAINIQNWPVFGMFMPDGITAFTANGQTFYVTANEGDSRGEERRIATLTLDPTAFPNAAALQQAAALGRLNASSIDGDLDGDGTFDRLQVYGARSFTIWDAAGARVYDSGDQLEQLTASLTPELFNANNGNPANWDERSDDKGPEPESVTTGVVDGRTYAFVALERAGGGIMVFDVTDPSAPTFVQYARSEGDISPEGVKFVAAADSPTGVPLLIVSNEISNSIRLFSIQPSQVTPTPPAATVTPAPTGTATAAPTATATVPPTATATATATPSPTATATPSPTPTRTLTPTPTRTPFVCNPSDPNQVCNGIIVVRVFVDFGCDSFFNAGRDWPLAGTTVTATLPDGTTKTAVVDFNGNATFSGISLPANTRLRLAIDTPTPPTWLQQQGGSLTACGGVSEVMLGRANFTAFHVAFVDFRYDLGR